MTIEQAQNLKTPKPERLVGKFLTYNIHLKEEKKKSFDKRIALKALFKDLES